MLDQIKAVSSSALSPTQKVKKDKAQEMYDLFLSIEKGMIVNAKEEVMEYMGMASVTYNRYCRFLEVCGLVKPINNRQWNKVRLISQELIPPYGIETRIEEIPFVEDTELVPYIEEHIVKVRDDYRILDADLAKVYGVSTRRLNQQYDRNKDLFEDDWVIRLTENEVDLWLQSGTTNLSSMSRSLPLVYNKESANSMAFQLPQSPVARQRSKTVIKVFTDLERMAHGEEPKQEDFKDLIAGIAREVFGETKVDTRNSLDILRDEIVGVLKPVNVKVNINTNSITKLEAENKSLRSKLNKEKNDRLYDKVVAKTRRLNTALGQLCRVEMKMLGLIEQHQFLAYWQQFARLYKYNKSNIPDTEVLRILNEKKENMKEMIKKDSYPVSCDRLSTEDQNILAQHGVAYTSLFRR